jgi:uncharacterized protein YjiS (DUF1127 family)
MQYLLVKIRRGNVILTAGGPIDLGSLQLEGDFAMVTARNDFTAYTSSIESSIARMCAKLAGGIVLWLRSRNTGYELRRLSDRALEDIGTTRADIARFARERDPWQRLPGDCAFILALGQLIERPEAWQTRRRERAKIYGELMAYSDRDLNELGVQRRDIGAISRGA